MFWKKPKPYSPLTLLITVTLSYFVIYPSVFLGIGSFFIRDYSAYEFPVCVYVKNALLHGEIPLWDPNNIMGIPMLAQWAPMVFYPPTIIYLILPTAWGVSLFMFAHLAFASLGMYFLIRKITASDKGAFYGAYLLGFSGIGMCLLTWPHITATFSWAPWVILTCLNYQQNPTTKKFILASGAASLQLLSGTPEFIIVTWFGVAFIVASQEKKWWNTKKLLGVVAMSTALAAIEILPFLVLVHQCSRGNTENADSYGGTIAQWHLTWSNLMNFICPLYNTVSTTTPFPKNELWLPSYYLTLPSLALATIAIKKTPNRQNWILLAGIIFSAAAATGLLNHLPVLNLIRFPIKYIFLAILLIPVLVGETIANNLLKQKHLCYTTAFGLLIVAISMADSTKATESALLAIVLGSITLLLLARKEAPLLIVLSMFTTVAIHNTKIQYVMPSKDIDHPPTNFPEPIKTDYRFCQNQPAKDWFIGKSPEKETLFVLLRTQLLAYNCNMLIGANTMDGFFPMYIVNNQAAELIAVDSQNTNILDFLSVKYTPTLTNNTITGTWTKRETWMPLATIGQKPTLSKTPIDQWKTTDFRKTVLLNQEIPTEETTNATVTITQMEPERWTLKTQSDKKTITVISQSWNPNWKATVNGKPTPILLANGMAQAIITPAGKATIQLQYKDNVFNAGATLSSLAWIALIGLAYKSKRNNN